MRRCLLWREGVFLTRFASKSKIVHRRDTLRGKKNFTRPCFPKRKSRFHLNHTKEINEASGKVGVYTCDVNVEKRKKSKLTAICIHRYVTFLSKPFVELGIYKWKMVYLETNERMETKILVFFAAGDVREKMLRQIVLQGDGRYCTQSAQHYVRDYLRN